MNKLRLFIYFSIAALLTSCGAKTNNAPSGDDLGVTWEILQNTYKGDARVKSEFVFTNNSETTIVDGDWEIYFNLCRLISADSLQVIDFMDFEHINGDLFKMSPNEKFQPLAPGQSIAIPMVAELWLINNTDAPAGLYVLNGKEASPISDYVVKSGYSPDQTNRFTNDVMPIESAQTVFDANQGNSLTSEFSKIVPTPLYMNEDTEEKITINNETTIQYASEDLADEAKFLSERLKELGLNVDAVNVKTLIPKAGVIILGITPTIKLINNAGPEAYEINASADNGIQINALKDDGVFYGIQSLRGLIDPAAYNTTNESIEINAVEVADAPRFLYRGMVLDVGRNFQKAEDVKKFIDLMAFYKLNRFHFHLSDDEGWRLEIKSLPELTEIGSKRGFTTDESDMLIPSFGSGAVVDAETNNGSGYYTREAFIDILKYATERHVMVIPEIDMPGHNRAAIKSMIARYEKLKAEGKEKEAEEFLLNDFDDKSEYQSVQMWDDNVVCPCQQSTYNFIEEVIDEVGAMYKEAGATLEIVHTGGDEVPGGVWVGSPKCQKLMDEKGLEDAHGVSNYFLKRYHEILTARNLRLAGWEEIAEAKEDGNIIANPEFLDANFLPTVWNNVWGWGKEDLAYKYANAGYEVVLCPATNLYFDLAYDKHPEEPGYYWAAFSTTKKAFEFTPFDIFKIAFADRNGNSLPDSLWDNKVALTEDGTKNISGIQGQVWSENNKGPALLEYLTSPRIMGLAERAWTQAPVWATTEDRQERISQIQISWNTFANALGQRELPRLDGMNGGYGYRLPTPGASIVDGKLAVNATFPGLIIRYTLDGSEPTAESPVFDASNAVEVSSGEVKLATFTSDNKRQSRTGIVKAN